MLASGRRKTGCRTDLRPALAAPRDLFIQDQRFVGPSARALEVLSVVSALPLGAPIVKVRTFGAPDCNARRSRVSQFTVANSYRGGSAVMIKAHS